MPDSRNKAGLNFKGIQKTTLLDYPDEIACTLFLGGCNFNCSYCYNPDLVLNKETGVSIAEEEVLEFLKERKKFLDGVCITGGEPLLHYPLLLGFLKKVKSLDYKIKIDTNGSFPHPLRKIIEEKVVDYIAMDIKAPLSRYKEIVGRPIDQPNNCWETEIEESVKLIKNSGVDYEFRTTVSSNLKADDFAEIRRWLCGSRRYYLQAVKTNVPLLGSEPAPPGAAYLQTIINDLRSSFGEVGVRG
jgi:pyruvate formate lyase activating enzyme